LEDQIVKSNPSRGKRSSVQRVPGGSETSKARSVKKRNSLKNIIGQKKGREEKKVGAARGTGDWQSARLEEARISRGRTMREKCTK